MPIIYYLKPKSYKLGDTLVEPYQTPTSMELISHGICDVIWISQVQNPPDPSKDKASQSKVRNPMKKFNEEVHQIVCKLETDQFRLNQIQLQRRDSRNLTMTNLIENNGFRVQRLIKGDALTVRALSSRANLMKSSMMIIASSSIVQTFELKSSDIQYLPPDLRVNNFHN